MKSYKILKNSKLATFFPLNENNAAMKFANTAFLLLLGTILLCSTGCERSNVKENKITVDAPFEMPELTELFFPDKHFNIVDFGATPDSLCTTAIAKTIKHCSDAGGGYVEIPAGNWLTGPIHLKSNVNLHIQEGARLIFEDDPSLYLPAVKTSWEGIECYNYSPLIYAYDCKNVAITGCGTIAPKMNLWRSWFRRTQPHLEALKNLYNMASTNVPVMKRQMAEGNNNLRPHLIHLNRTKNIVIDSINIRHSPFWTIHLYMCDNVIARNLNVMAMGHNNDGIDVEMTQNVLVENCTFDQGDDAVVLKAGRNHDAWRLNTPTRNIVVRNCTVKHGHVLLGIGSEMSSGVENVYMHDCNVESEVFRLFFVKTNHRRGGFVRNIYMENVKAEKLRSVMEVDMDVLYQWRTLVKTYDTAYSEISNLYMKNIVADSTKCVIDIKGDSHSQVKNVSIENLTVNHVSGYTKNVENAENVTIKNLIVKKSNQQ